MAIGIEFAVRGVAPAHVLHHHDITLAGVPGGVLVDAGLSEALVVGSALQQDWTGALADRTVDVGAQHHPVRHRHGDVRFKPDVIETPQRHSLPSPAEAWRG